jgi:hypothetical protein
MPSEGPKIFRNILIFFLTFSAFPVKTRILRKNRIMNRATKTILALLAGSFLLYQQAQAAPINGAIEFFGSASASGPSGGTPVTISFANPWHSLAATGSYTPILTGTDFTFNGFTFTGDGSAATLGAPDMPIWTATVSGVTYSFDLLALTNGHTESGSMAFTGTGIAHITGMDDTPASFALQGAGSGFNFTLSSSSTATIPEGNTTVLLVLGLVLIGAVMLRQKLAA